MIEKMNAKFRRVVVSICVLALLACVLAIPISAVANTVTEVGPEESPDYGQVAQEQPQKVTLGMNFPALVRLPPAAQAATDKLAELDERRRSKLQPLQIGFERRFTPLLISVSLKDIRNPNPGRGSEFLSVEGSEMVWAGHITVSDAFAFRIHMDDVELPPSARVWVYNSAGESLGPFSHKSITDNGILWLPPLQGDQIYIEIRASVSDLENGDQVRFRLQRVTEIISGIANEMGGGNTALDPQVWTDCSIDISCEAGAPFDIDSFATGVARLVFEDDGGGFYLCTGALVSDTVDGSFIPYLLTANHCFDSETEADSLVSYFRYRSEVCGGAPPSIGSVPQVSGADLLASSPDSDFTLVQLDANPPGGSWFLGWTTGGPTAGQTLYNLSHPAGDKAHYETFSFNETGGLICGGLPRPNFHYSTVLSGSTTGGSSGSPMYSDTGQIMGQLLGACHIEPWDDCSYDTYNRVDGAFGTTYPFVQEWLNPDATCVDDEYEEDDVCFGTQMLVGDSQVHKHCDEDWVFFNPMIGRTYAIETSNIVGDTTLALHISCGEEILFDDDGGSESLASRIEWTADTSSSTDIRIRQFGDAYTAGDGYTVTVTDISPPQDLGVSKSGTGTGTVTSDPAGINCGVDCTELFDYGTLVTLTAAPDAGSEFVGWSGQCSGTNPVTDVTVDSSKICDAEFALTTTYYTLSVSKSGDGSGLVTSSPPGIDCGVDCDEDYVAGTLVTLTATPEGDSDFVGWSGSCAGANPVTNVTMSAAKDCDAEFEFAVIYYTLSVSTSGDGSGAVTSSPAGIDCGVDCNEDYAADTLVTLTAAPNAGSEFTGWSGSCSGTNPVTDVTVNSVKSCDAAFAIDAPGPYQVIYSDPESVGAMPGGSANFDVMYDVSDADATLTGMGVRVHFDSSVLTFDAITAHLVFGSLFDPDLVTPEADASDFDGDPGTDSFISLAWTEFGGAWPGTIPESLASLSFTTDPGFTGSTQVNFTASDTAAGYSLDATPVTVFEQLCNLDVDGNLSYGALTDGVLIVRYLFGFTGAQLTDGAIGNGATRTDAAAVIDYLDGCQDMLDADANGSAGALTDGVLIVRYLFGFTGAQLTDGALAPDATRTNPVAIRDFLDGFTPDLGAASQPMRADKRSSVGEQHVASTVSRSQLKNGNRRYEVQAEFTTSVLSQTGLGLRMHFDSSVLSLESLGDILQTGLLQSQVQDDILDYDSDPSTDRFIMVAWMDPMGSWPGSYEAQLFKATFTMPKGKGSKNTNIHYSVAGASEGMDTSLESVNVGPGRKTR